MTHGKLCYSPRICYHSTGSGSYLCLGSDGNDKPEICFLFHGDRNCKSKQKNYIYIEGLVIENTILRAVPSPKQESNPTDFVVEVYHDFAVKI